jgi:hypothetical protein
VDRLVVSVQSRLDGRPNQNPGDQTQDPPANGSMPWLTVNVAAHPPAAAVDLAQPEAKRTIEIRLCRKRNGSCDTPAVQLVEMPGNKLIKNMWQGAGQPDTIKEIGKLIRRDLDRHIDIKNSLAEVFAQTEKTPIHFILGAPEADDYPWELLYDSERQFVDVDRCPIGRIKNCNNRKVHKELSPPLRVLAVLAATGPNISAKEEWLAIRNALEKNGVDFKLHAFVCETGLQEDIDKLKSNRFTVELVPPSAKEILNFIGKWQPQLIHFFATPGNPSLISRCASAREATG